MCHPELFEAPQLGDWQPGDFSHLLISLNEKEVGSFRRDPKH